MKHTNIILLNILYHQVIINKSNIWNELYPLIWVRSVRNNELQIIKVFNPIWSLFKSVIGVNKEWMQTHFEWKMWSFVIKDEKALREGY